jgi:hypothetical protein
VLTYGGAPLLTLPVELAAWVSANISPKDVYDFERLNWPGKNLTGLSFPGTARMRPVVPNTLYWPTGASRWAVGYFFVSAQQLQDIHQQLQYAYQSLPFVMGDNAHAPITTNLWMLPPRPLGQAGDAANGLYLLTLVDDRYWWWFNSTGNLTINPGTTTWENLYQSLGTQLGLIIQADPIDPAYLTPSQSLQSLYEYVPLVLDAVAYNVGQRIVRDYDGTVRAQLVGNAQTVLETNIISFGFPKGGGTMPVFSAYGLDDAPEVLPATVQVVFPASGSGSSASGTYAVSVALASLGLSTIGSQGAPFTKVFHDGRAAVFTGPTYPTNQAELQALVKQIATDWYQFQASPLDIKYSGIIPWQLEGLSDSIEWSYRETPRELTTRIQRPPWNDLAQELLHGGKNAAADIETYKARTTSTISALSGTTAGSGTVQIYQLDPGTGALTATSDPPFTAWNNSTSTIATNMFVELVREPTSEKYFIVAPGSGSALKLINQPSTIVDLACTILESDDDDLITFANISAGNDKLVINGLTIDLTVVTSVVCDNTGLHVGANVMHFKKGILISVT